MHTSEYPENDGEEEAGKASKKTDRVVQRLRHKDRAPTWPLWAPAVRAVSY